jgi:hypothetical protein
MLMETRSVLVVEDERSIQHTLATVLTVVGCTAHRAGNVEIRYSHGRVRHLHDLLEHEPDAGCLLSRRESFVLRLRDLTNATKPLIIGARRPQRPSISPDRNSAARDVRRRRVRTLDARH